MQATPISRTNRSTKTINIGALIKGLAASIHVAVDNRKIRRWPAVRLAASRRPKAIGWANSLIVSIHTIRGMSALGVPCGTRCLSRLLKAR